MAAHEITDEDEADKVGEKARVCAPPRGIDVSRGAGRGSSNGGGTGHGEHPVVVICYDVTII